MADVTVQDVWAMVPDVRCKGLCEASCSRIGMTKAERALLPEEFPSMAEQGTDYQADPVGYRCPLLVNGRCSAYAVRPLVCRIWGAEESLPCPHGCAIRGGQLSHSEGSSLMQIMLQVGGGVAE